MVDNLRMCQNVTEQHGKMLKSNFTIQLITLTGRQLSNQTKNSDDVFSIVLVQGLT